MSSVEIIPSTPRPFHKSRQGKAAVGLALLGLVAFTSFSCGAAVTLGPAQNRVPEVVYVTQPPEVVTKFERVEIPVKREVPDDCFEMVDNVIAFMDAEGDITGAAGRISLAAQDAQMYSTQRMVEEMVPNIQIIRDNLEILESNLVERSPQVHLIQRQAEACHIGLSLGAD